mgnify:CR=1 FL=1
MALICIQRSASFGQQTDVPAFLSSELEFLWESENTLEVPESVLIRFGNLLKKFFNSNLAITAHTM